MFLLIICTKRKKKLKQLDCVVDLVQFLNALKGNGLIDGSCRSSIRGILWELLQQYKELALPQHAPGQAHGGAMSTELHASPHEQTAYLQLSVVAGSDPRDSDAKVTELLNKLTGDCELTADGKTVAHPHQSQESTTAASTSSPAHSTKGTNRGAVLICIAIAALGLIGVFVWLRCGSARSGGEEEDVASDEEFFDAFDTNFPANEGQTQGPPVAGGAAVTNQNAVDKGPERVPIT